MAAVPVVASGGAGQLEHFYEAVVKGGASILLAASVFHFRTFAVRQVKAYLCGRDLNLQTPRAPYYRKEICLNLVLGATGSLPASPASGEKSGLGGKGGGASVLAPRDSRYSPAVFRG